MIALERRVSKTEEGVEECEDRHREQDNNHRDQMAMLARIEQALTPSNRRHDELIEWQTRAQKAESELSEVKKSALVTVPPGPLTSLPPWMTKWQAVLGLVIALQVVFEAAKKAFAWAVNHVK
jgi:hypothetical protein